MMPRPEPGTLTGAGQRTGACKPGFPERRGEVRTHALHERPGSSLPFRCHPGSWTSPVCRDRMTWRCVGRSVYSRSRAPTLPSRTDAVSPDPCVNPEPFDPAHELAFVQAVLAGREAAVVMFGQRMLCVPRMLGALNRRRARPLQDHDLADLVQDTILIVMRKLHEFRAFVPLEGWIFRLSYLEFLNAVRRRGRQREQPMELGEQTLTTGPDTRHDHDDLHLALEELGGAEAEVIRMKYFTELTYEEIGVLLAVPANTVKTRFHRGLAKLTERLNSTRRREERTR